MSFIDWLLGKPALHIPSEENFKTFSTAAFMNAENAEEQKRLDREWEDWKRKSKMREYVYFRSAEHIARTLVPAFETDQNWFQFFEVPDSGLADAGFSPVTDVNTKGFEQKFCVGYRNEKHEQPCTMYIHNWLWDYEEKVYGPRSNTIEVTRYIGDDVAIYPQVLDALRELREKGCSI